MTNSEKGLGRTLPAGGTNGQILKVDDSAVNGFSFQNEAVNAGALAILQNLADLDNIITARSNLGLGTAATQNAAISLASLASAATYSVGFITGDVPYVTGGVPSGTKFLRDDGVWATP